MKVVIAIQEQTPHGARTAARLRLDLEFVDVYAACEGAEREAIEARAADAVAEWLTKWKASHRRLKRSDQAVPVTLQLPKRNTIPYLKPAKA